MVPRLPAAHASAALDRDPPDLDAARDALDDADALLS
jgi:hypothetical protein